MIALSAAALPLVGDAGRVTRTSLGVAGRPPILIAKSPDEWVSEDGRIIQKPLGNDTSNPPSAPPPRPCPLRLPSGGTLTLRARDLASTSEQWGKSPSVRRTEIAAHYQDTPKMSLVVRIAPLSAFSTTTFAGTRRVVVRAQNSDRPYAYIEVEGGKRYEVTWARPSCGGLELLHRTEAVNALPRKTGTMTQPVHGLPPGLSISPRLSP